MKFSRLSLACWTAGALLFTTSVAPSATAQCPTYSSDFTAPGISGSVGNTLVFDDGSGAALYSTGGFALEPGQPAVGVARWNGANWTELGTWIGGQASALCVFDDGSGAKLYAAGNILIGGQPQAGIARFDGATWSAYTTSLSAQATVASDIRTLAVYDSGAGPKLWVGGDISSSAGTHNVAMWDGTTWTFPGGGLHLNSSIERGVVLDLEVFDDGLGGGPALYASGDFSHAGVSTSLGGRNVARTYGASWSGTGTGLGFGSDRVVRLLPFDDGVTTRLVANRGDAWSQMFLHAWDGSAWVPFDNTFHSLSLLNAFGPGAGEASGLWAHGVVDVPGGTDLFGLLRWSGGGWSEQMDGFPFPMLANNTLNALPTGTGTRLVTQFGGLTAVRDATTWEFAGGGGANLPVMGAASIRAPGRASQLFVAGSFTAAGGQFANGLAHFDGTQWSNPLPGNLVAVYSMKLLTEPTGDALYFGGEFPYGTPAILRYDAAGWSNLPPLPFSYPRDFVSWNDAGTVRLVAASSNVYAWAGNAWAQVLSSGGLTSSLVAFDPDGGGEALYVGGQFSEIDGIPVQGVARLRNGSLVSLGVGPTVPTLVNQLLVHDDGTGPALYACGRFTDSIGGPWSSAGSVYGVARWNGATWTMIGVLSTAVGTNAVRMISHDDGSGTGPRLVLGGTFTTVNGVAAAHLAAFDGTNWAPIGQGIGPSMSVYSQPFVAALATVDEGDGRGADLFVAGNFTRAFGLEAYGLARVESCGGAAQTFCHADGSGAACPCGNNSAIGERAGCRNSSGTGATLRVSGRASLSSDTLQLEGDVFPNAIGLYFQGTTQVAGGAGVVFGDGLKCTGGPFVRLAIRSSTSSHTAFPGNSGAPVSVQGLLSTPGTRHYQVRYRDAVAYCTSDTFNYTNGVAVQWQP